VLLSIVHVQLATIPTNITIVQGENALWYRKDNGSMPSQHTVAMGDLRIENITKEEEGTFVCLAENVLGSRTVQATVSVNGMLFIHMSNGALTTRSGNTNGSAIESNRT